MTVMTDDQSIQYPSSEVTHAADKASVIEEPDIQRPTDQYDPFLVQFEEGDPMNPMNWSRTKRWYITMVSGLLVFNATFASSAPSGIAEQLAEEFHLSRIVTTLTIALFVAGYVVGPLFWGPLSEQYGRRPIFIVSFFVYVIFQIAMAVSNNTAQILVFRFIGGAFAACPLANSGAVISDIWDAKTRGKALAIFTLMPFAGPVCGPVVGGYMSVAGVSWRWVFWLLCIFAGACFGIIVLTLPETYAPILLVKKAEMKRKETGEKRLYASMERNKLRLAKRLEHILARPFRILFREPMLMACTLYMSFVYGVIYLNFESYPVVFTQGHHLNMGASGLMFIPIMLGGMTAIALYIFIFNPRYEKRAKELAPNPVPPEFRLEIAMVASVLYPISFFWLGWTSFPSISFWAPMMSGLLLGFCISWIFLSLFNYMIDTYLMMAASALSANTVVRSAFGAGFPLFATQMYERLNPRWASTLLGCIALLMTPIPFVFYKFGPTLRRKSRYAPTPAPRTPAKEMEDSPA